MEEQQLPEEDPKEEYPKERDLHDTNRRKAGLFAPLRPTLPTPSAPPRPKGPAPNFSRTSVMGKEVSGWLRKKGEVGLKDWKWRWFHRKAGEDRITYSLEPDKGLKGLILLNDVKGWIPNGALGTPLTDERGFHIMTQRERKARTYVLLAEDDTEYDKWTTFLTSYLKEKGMMKSGITLTLETCIEAPSKCLAASIICTNKASLHSCTRMADDTVKWSEDFFIENPNLNDNVRFKLYSYHPVPTTGKFYNCLGITDIKMKDLIARPKRKLILAKVNYDPLVNEKNGKVTFLKVSIKEDMFPKDWKWPEKKKKLEDSERRVMIVTRGTQGDVQPFVALARGLAELEGFDVILCTELSFRDFVKSNAEVKRGSIRFRPSGGDTASAIDDPISQWAIKRTSAFLQAAMIARSEAEFFPSHFLIHHWTEKLKPTCFIYGFTMATVTATMSEKHGIPAIGFILQPTCIPSKSYTPVVDIATFQIKAISDTLTSHETLQTLKSLMESNAASLREHYEVKKLPADFNIWKSITERNMPLIIPIKAGCFGGKPEDWHENARLTDFIFLRKGPTAELPQKFVDFINNAKTHKRPIVVIGFSSMPVPRADILGIVNSLVSKCERHPAVIALVGNRDFSQERVPEQIEKEAQKLKSYGMILEEKGAPFGRLFPFMDTIIVHGGLGTTAEALRVGVPVIVTGVLLMDQRFWGKRVHDLGVGPKPIRINDFLDKCVKVVNRALDEEGEWKSKAKSMATQHFGDGEGDDGVRANVTEFMKFFVEKEKWVF